MEEEGRENLKGKIVESKDQRGPSRKGKQEQMPLEVKLNKNYRIVRGKTRLEPKICGV